MTVKQFCLQNAERQRDSTGEASDNAPVAQLVEQLPFKEKVRGSNPLGGTFKNESNSKV